MTIYVKFSANLQKNRIEFKIAAMEIFSWFIQNFLFLCLVYKILADFDTNRDMCFLFTKPVLEKYP